MAVVQSRWIKSSQESRCTFSSQDEYRFLPNTLLRLESTLNNTIEFARETGCPYTRRIELGAHSQQMYFVISSAEDVQRTEVETVLITHYKAYLFICDFAF